jgi:hypothetical protein
MMFMRNLIPLKPHLPFDDKSNFTRSQIPSSVIKQKKLPPAHDEETQHLIDQEMRVLENELAELSDSEESDESDGACKDELQLLEDERKKVEQAKEEERQREEKRREQEAVGRMI